MGRAENLVVVFIMLITILWTGTMLRTTPCRSFKVVSGTGAGFVTLTGLRNIIRSLEDRCMIDVYLCTQEKL